jgi:transcriptional regulator with XRE-family HTH domain
MPKKKANIKEILAANLRENRRKKGLTQEKLAEMADMSLRYLATLELGNNFPSGEMIEKLAKALDIQAFQLFYPSSTPEGALLHLEQTIVANIEKELEQFRQDIIQEIKNNYDDKLERSMVFNIENVVKMSVKQAVANEFENFKRNKKR